MSYPCVEAYTFTNFIDEAYNMKLILVRKFKEQFNFLDIFRIRSGLPVTLMRVRFMSDVTAEK